MGAFRGGGTFPAIFLGTVGGLLADHLPGLPQGAAVAIVLAAAIVSVLRLPLSSVVIATGLVSGAGAASATLVVISVVVAYIAVDKIFDRRGVPALAVGGPEHSDPPEQDGAILGADG